MYFKILLLSTLIVLVTEFTVSYLITDKRTVWQNFSDICYFDINRAQQHNNRQARCQLNPNIIVEKRFFEGLYEICFVISTNKTIYNITIDDEYKKHNWHMPVALGPKFNVITRVIHTKINRNLFDPHHLLDLDANLTVKYLSDRQNLVESISKITIIENSLFEIFDECGITCHDIQTSMLDDQYLLRKSWMMMKISFLAKRQVDISRSFTIIYNMGDNTTCPVPINIKTINSTNIAEMIFYQGPFASTTSQPSQTLNLQVQSPMSIIVNGIESCNPFLARVPDPILDNQPNINPFKFYDKCRELNWERAEPESAYCENLPEVNVRMLILNGETKFWCVTVDKKFAPLKYENDSKPMAIKIEMNYSKNFVRWYNKSNSITFNSETVFAFEVEHQIMLSIEPQMSNVGEIKSLKVNGLESCGLVLENIACGEQKIKHRPFIAYGLPTYPGQYPWHVAIYENMASNGKRYICGGSIIGTNTVLTAAHCVVRNNQTLNPDVLVFEVGRFDLLHATKYTIVFEVIKVVPHENYNEEYFENDIAILKSKRYMKFNDFVQPICLTSNGNSLENEIGYVPGWGKNELNERENVLSEASVPIVDSSDCRASKRGFFQSFLTDGKFCGGYRNGTTFCSGDSGGGLVVEFPTRWFIKGIVSIGYSDNGLCDGNVYVLFTDIVYYNNWIKSVLLK